MIGESVAAKYAPPLAGAAIAVAVPLPFDPALGAVVVAGLIIGIVFRAGLMIERRKAKSDILRDLLVSLMIGGANFVFAVAIIRLTKVSDPIVAIGIAATVAISGVRTGQMAVKWVWKRLVEQEVAEHVGQARQEAQKELSLGRAIARDIGDET
ncbi:MAG: hypothetical protein V4696_07425 [Pseudomonadota bacterium]